MCFSLGPKSVPAPQTPSCASVRRRGIICMHVVMLISAVNHHKAIHIDDSSTCMITATAAESKSKVSFLCITVWKLSWHHCNRPSWDHAEASGSTRDSSSPPINNFWSCQLASTSNHHENVLSAKTHMHMCVQTLRTKGGGERSNITKFLSTWVNI